MAIYGIYFFLLGVLNPGKSGISWSVYRNHSDEGKSKRKKGKTPAGKFDDPRQELETEEVVNMTVEQEPLERFPDDKNPVTGESEVPGDLNLLVMVTGKERGV